MLKSYSRITVAEAVCIENLIRHRFLTSKLRVERDSIDRVLGCLFWSLVEDIAAISTSWVKLTVSSLITRPCPMVRETGVTSVSAGQRPASIRPHNAHAEYLSFSAMVIPFESVRAAVLSDLLRRMSGDSSFILQLVRW
jgi:hypothetical protein